MKTVRELMFTGSDNPVVDENSCFRDVLEAMNIQSMGAANVVDGDGRLLGIITDGDLRRLILKTQDTLPELFMKRVSGLMTRNPISASPDERLDECLKVFKKHRFWVLPVVDPQQRLLGMIHLHRLLSGIEK